MFDLNISPEQKRALTILATLCLGVGGFFFLNSRPSAISESAQELSQELAMVIPDTATSAVIVNVAVISVGEENTYGHPAPDLISEFERRGVKVLRTDRSGGIAISTPNKIRVTGKDWWQIRWG